MELDYTPMDMKLAVRAVSSFRSGSAIKPRDLLLGALADIRKEMEQAVDLHCGWHIREIESHIVERGIPAEEQQMKLIHLREADKWFREYGCTVCDLGPDGFELTDCADSISGSSIIIQNDECFGKPRGNAVGAFHTHPYGLPTPSYADIMSTFIGNRRVNFIGGQVGEYKAIVGYSPHPESAMRWEIKQRIEPFEEYKNEDVDTVINFLYRPPGATSPDSVSVKQYAVFDDDEKMDHFIKNLEYLDGIFEVVVHWI